MTIKESIIHYQDKQGINNLTLCKECGGNGETFIKLFITEMDNFFTDAVFLINKFYHKYLQE